MMPAGYSRLIPHQRKGCYGPVCTLQVRATDLAGPEPQDRVDMARRTLAARGASIRLIPSWQSGLLGVDAAGEVLVPGPEARLVPTTCDPWRTGRSATA